jgi:hypothetical protein
VPARQILVVKYLSPVLSAQRSEFFAKDALIVTREQVADNATPRFALEMASRIKGLFKTEQENVCGQIKVLLIDRVTRPPRLPAVDIRPREPTKSDVG